MPYPVFISIVGSRLYNMATDESDTDIKGIMFEDIDQIIGLRHIEQQEYKNDLEGNNHIEGTLYTVSRAFHLLQKGNPTILEPFFANTEYHVLNSKVSNEIRKFVQNTFLTKSLFKPYSAYHRAQVRKLQTIEPVGKRKAIVEKFGLDTKFASHAFRLATQCIQIMKEGTLDPTLTGDNLQIAKDIRIGKYDKTATLAILEDVDKKMYAAYQNTTLPESPNFHNVNTYLVDLYRNYIIWLKERNDMHSVFGDLPGILETSDILKQVKEIVIPQNET